MPTLPKLLIDMIQKMLLNRSMRDDSIFYDKVLDAVIDGNAHIIMGRTDPVRECNVINQHQMDNNLGHAVKVVASDDQSEKLEPPLPELPRIEAKDAWI